METIAVVVSAGIPGGRNTKEIIILLIKEEIFLTVGHVCVCLCVWCGVVWCGVVWCVRVCSLHLIVKHQILGQVKAALKVKSTVTFALFSLTDTDIKTNTVFDLVILQAKHFIYKCT